MALDLYLDECANSNLLAHLLRQAGHQVIRPTDPDVNLAKASDPVQMDFAIRQGLILITKNPDDFLELHNENPNHHGIIGIHQDNDKRGDMSDAEIVKAIKNLEDAIQIGADPFPKHFHLLNQWRY